MDSPISLPTLTIHLIERKQLIFDSISQIFPEFMSKQISQKENIDATPSQRVSLTYGEIEFRSLGEIFETINLLYGPLPTGGVFYDLGSGSGKAVLGAALLHNFSVCKGIELVKGLHSISMSLKSCYSQQTSEILSKNQDIFSALPKIEFLNDDILTADWSEASFILITATCFSDQMIEVIASMPVKAGTWAVSMSKPFKSESWQLLHSFRKPMGWGFSIVYIHQRL